MFQKLLRILSYGCYYGIARHLPRSYELFFVGRFSSWCRRVSSRALFRECGRFAHIERNADFGSGRNVVLKDYSCLGENARFMRKGTVFIGEDAMMGPDVLLVSENHRFGKESFEGYDVGSITIGEHAWIGARAVLLKDVVIGRYTVVGAGAVVAKSIPDYGIAVGNPAKVVKYRTDLVSPSGTDR